MQSDLECRVLDEIQLRLAIELPRTRKMEVLHAIAGLGAEVEDVEIATPGLEALYRDLVEARGEAGVAA